MQFDFVDHGGVGRDGFGAFGAEGELVGEIKTVDAASIHELHGVDEAREHGRADDMHDGAPFAVGLVEGFAGEHEVTAVVEGDALCEVGVGAFALL